MLIGTGTTDTALRSIPPLGRIVCRSVLVERPRLQRGASPFVRGVEYNRTFVLCQAIRGNTTLKSHAPKSFDVTRVVWCSDDRAKWADILSHRLAFHRLWGQSVGTISLNLRVIASRWSSVKSDRDGPDPRIAFCARCGLECVLRRPVTRARIITCRVTVQCPVHPLHPFGDSCYAK